MGTPIQLKYYLFTAMYVSGKIYFNRKALTFTQPGQRDAHAKKKKHCSCNNVHPI